MPIAFDTSATGNEGTGTSLTYSHTCSGSNRILFVLTRGGSGEGNLISSVTYDGTAMTLASGASVTVPTENTLLRLYFLTNPSSGNNNVVITLSSSGFMQSISTSYTGANVSNQVDNTTTNTTSSATSLTTSLTPVADNCWIVLACRSEQDAQDAGTGATQRQLRGDRTGIYDNNANISPPASTNMQVTFNSGPAGVAMASFSPASFVPKAMMF